MQISLLGPLEVSEDGRPVRVPGEKLRSIVAVLSLNAGRPVPRSELIDELWDEEPPRSAENSLHGHIARLRRLLAVGAGKGRLRDTVQTSAAGYALALPQEAVDAFRFERLVAEAETVQGTQPARAVELLTGALGLWRGPALLDTGQGLSCRMAYTRLEGVRLTAYEHLFDARLRLGQHRAVVAELEQLHARYPLREHFCEQLITALYRSGRQAEALDTYHRTRRRLADSLGLEPCRSLRTRFQEVLRQDPSLM
ncbi:AfsR/SARP family transcriptional regulator [Streptacidiphilus sp. ASG 303]|uniref:AfsR/SARP family transcriptional regulator n=1 Tax=Streptacidiphilus sp. ASG 303 TaxID=2896847 RepID=UPI001E5DBB76|nr:AfsR/SARP family transcriptional regulator [Streptacidiphilus sp. ASG 303]MCD0484733.1 AfsR/SARP family transcriptional regulator [Streptacidiphilus sp. ASG 303]